MYLLRASTVPRETSNFQLNFPFPWYWWSSWLSTANNKCRKVTGMLFSSAFCSVGTLYGGPPRLCHDLRGKLSAKVFLTDVDCWKGMPNCIRQSQDVQNKRGVSIWKRCNQASKTTTRQNLSQFSNTHQMGQEFRDFLRLGQSVIDCESLIYFVKRLHRSQNGTCQRAPTSQRDANFCTP